MNEEKRRSTKLQADDDEAKSGFERVRALRGRDRLEPKPAFLPLKPVLKRETARRSRKRPHFFSISRVRRPESQRSSAATKSSSRTRKIRRASTGASGSGSAATDPHGWASQVAVQRTGGWILKDSDAPTSRLNSTCQRPETNLFDRMIAGKRNSSASCS